jgi:hypothetical protein
VSLLCGHRPSLHAEGLTMLDRKTITEPWHNPVNNDAWNLFNLLAHGHVQLDV